MVEVKVVRKGLQGAVWMAFDVSTVPYHETSDGSLDLLVQPAR